LFLFFHSTGSLPVSSGGVCVSGGMASENTRKELKALVGARTMQRGMSGVVINNLNQSLGSGLMNRNSPPTVPSGKPLNQADLEALGLSCELPQGIQTK
jgi:hypothetical protein